MFLQEIGGGRKKPFHCFKTLTSLIALILKNSISSNRELNGKKIK